MPTRYCSSTAASSPIIESPGREMTDAADASRTDGLLLTLNAGSSSLKFALFAEGASPVRIMAGEVDRVGSEHATLTLREIASGQTRTISVSSASQAACLDKLFELLAEVTAETRLAAVGHRVVHGLDRYNEPQIVTSEMIDNLQRMVPSAPEHLPAEIELIAALDERFPDLPQIACFDTAFHRDLPRVARLLPIPRRYETQGVRRYGFHGLSYEFLMEELERSSDPTAATGRIILAHLGHGASLAAVRDGKSIDTSMGFTPAAGLVMGTRSGDLDPSLVSFLARTEQMTAARFDQMVNHESGLLGVSGTSSDMQDLLMREEKEINAAEAVALFCYQTKKWIGSFAAALGGLDTLVFAGGIGENAPAVRARICDGLEFLGIELDEIRNDANEPLISARAGRVAVRVIRTDEELMIARSVYRVLNLGTKRKRSRS